MPNTDDLLIDQMSLRQGYPVERALVRVIDVARYRHNPAANEVTVEYCDTPGEYYRWPERVFQVPYDIFTAHTG